MVIVSHENNKPPQLFDMWRLGGLVNSDMPKEDFFHTQSLDRHF